MNEVEMIGLQMAALSKADLLIRGLERAGQITLAIRDAWLADIRRKLDVLGDRLVTLDLTQGGATPILSTTQAQKLRDSVKKLNEQNVGEAALRAILGEVLIIAETFSNQGATSFAAPSAPPPQPVFGNAGVTPSRAGSRFAETSDVATPVPPGRYGGLTPELSVELRVGGVDDGVISADLFRRDAAGQLTWVASLRSVGAVETGQIPIVAEDRYHARAEGYLNVSPASPDAVHLLVFLDGKLDGLPLRRQFALTANYLGASLRRIALEVEVEKDVLGPPQIVFRDTAMSIEAALANAGIETRPGGSTDIIPKAPPDGWSEKDIEAISVAAAQVDLSQAAFELQMLWLSKSNRPGLLGVMFDTADDRPRQSLAVFAGEIREMLAGDAARQDRKLIQTAVHEIGHALNLAHRFEREVGRADSTSFMNYDWRYRGGQRSAEFWNRFSYSFDSDELAFLRHAPHPAIVMGGAHFHSVRYWHEGDGGYSPYVPEHPLPGISLHLTAAMSGFFRFAQPVTMSIRLENKTGRPLRLPASVLDPKAGFVEILVRRIARGRPSSDAPESFHPVVTRCFEVSADQTIEIPAGGSHEDNLNLTFGASGFTFAEPGTYEITALLVFFDEMKEIELIAPSEPSVITIGYPEERRDYGLADLLFQPDVGRWFALGAPSRLSPVGDKLVELAQGAGSGLPDEISAHVLRTAMFGANRPSMFSDQGKMRRVASDPKRASDHARRLGKLDLDVFDPATRKSTESYIAEQLSGDQKAADLPVPSKRARTRKPSPSLQS